MIAKPAEIVYNIHGKGVLFLAEFTVLAVGDVIGSAGRAFLAARLSSLRQETGAGLCIVNGENASDTNGISKENAAELFAAGADVITTGNHAFHKKNAGALFEAEERVLRPANYHASLPGKGWCIVDCGPVRVMVLNLAGTVFLPPAGNPFDEADRLLAHKEDAAITVIDFHAEATSEKRGLAEYLGGRVGFIFGTHTHVQTADEQILKNGTAFITDLGMTGPIDSVIGMEPDCAVSRLRTGVSAGNVFAEGRCMLCGAAVTFDRKTGRPVSIRRIRIEG